MAATNIDDVRFHLMGLLGSIFGAKAALLHGGEITIETFQAIQDDVQAALDALGDSPTGMAELTNKMEKIIVADKQDRKSYRQVVGTAAGFLGDEKPEDVIRRARGD